MYARGLTQREIRAHLEEPYQVSVSADLIRRVTDAVHEEVKQWQGRPLDAVYPVLFFDALRVRIRDEGAVRSKAVYLALGIRADGTKEILELWIEQSEGARFWLRVMSELKGRRVQDCLIAVVDGLKGFPEAIRRVFPQAAVQTCIVHLMRHGLSLCSYKERREMAGGACGGSTGPRAPRRRHWEEVVPVFAFDPEIRRLMYTTKAIENLHRRLRKTLKTRGHFPSDRAASKLLYFAIRNMEELAGARGTLAAGSQPPRHTVRQQTARSRFNLIAILPVTHFS